MFTNKIAFKILINEHSINSQFSINIAVYFVLDVYLVPSKKPREIMIIVIIVVLSTGFIFGKL